MNHESTRTSPVGSRKIAARVYTIAAVSLLALALVALAYIAPVTAEEDAAVSGNIKLIEDFVAAFNAKDVDKIMEIFGPDPVYHNMPGPPVKGAAAVRGLVESFLTPAENVNWEILNIAESGDTVLAERIDRFVINGKDIALPCNGAFVIKDGRIAEWRDYFDMATWTRQMGS